MERSPTTSGQDAAGARRHGHSRAPSSRSGRRPSRTRRSEKFRAMLRDGKLEDQRGRGAGIGPGDALASRYSPGSRWRRWRSPSPGLSNIFGGKKKKKTVTVAEARRDHPRARSSTSSSTRTGRPRRPASASSRSGIVFIDEIDKIANREGKVGRHRRLARGRPARHPAHRRGLDGQHEVGRRRHHPHPLHRRRRLQRLQAPDLIPELQGRFPIRVELEALSAADFERILTEPKNALSRSTRQLLSTEGVELAFTRTRR